MPLVYDRTGCRDESIVPAESVAEAARLVALAFYELQDTQRDLNEANKQVEHARWAYAQAQARHEAAVHLLAVVARHKGDA